MQKKKNPIVNCKKCWCLGNLFQVETLGDAVYMVAGGVPDRNENHAVNVAGLAIELVEKAASLTDPVSGDNLQLRAGQFLKLYLTESVQSLQFLCIVTITVHHKI